MSAPHLTPKQHKVLETIAEGMTAEEAARYLFLSIATVKQYRYEVCQLLAAVNAPHAVAIAFREGLLT